MGRATAAPTSTINPQKTRTLNAGGDDMTGQVIRSPVKGRTAKIAAPATGPLCVKSRQMMGSAGQGNASQWRSYGPDFWGNSG
jgi:hypothetical protein